MTDIEIANSVKLKNIVDIATKLGVKQQNLELYGNYKAKISNVNVKKNKSKLILVTAINPTAAGEGKTTMSIGLADGLNVVGKNVCLALREPSLGPVFGIKGGATGGGYSQVVPMEDINLHFTGDFHAITSANNLLSAMIDNHIHQGNLLNIDVNNIVFNRTMDMNDRALRSVQVAQGGKLNGVIRQDQFTITSASEIMAIMCLSSSIDDLKDRLSNILVAYDVQGNPVYCKQLNCQDSMAILLKDALKPNIVQTLIGTPALIHLGPFANIAHGCNSNIATKTAMSYADYVVTEAGFGADLGAEKFLDIKCRTARLKPNCVVIVATIRALKMQGGASKEQLDSHANLTHLKDGLPHLLKHLNNIRNKFKLPVVCAINKFSTDTKREIDAVVKFCKDNNFDAIECDAYSLGGKGCTNLAKQVIEMCEQKNNDFSYIYDLDDSIEDKIFKVATEIYGASSIEFSSQALSSLKKIKQLNMTSYPIVIAKTQYSFSDDKKLLGVPTNFSLKVRDLQIRNGAKFIVVIAGDIMLMPGLGKQPAATKMHIDNNGNIEGLF